MQHLERPRIAVLLDENTSTGGTRYEAHKGCFHGLAAAGAAPFGVPYVADMVAGVAREFEALLAVGGRFSYPDDWYLDGEVSRSLPSPRLEVERAAMTAFLAARKPVLGICAGMQMLGCLHGSRLTPDLAAWRPSALPHDQVATAHRVNLREGSMLHRIVGGLTVLVNSYHREALAEIGAGVTVCAHADDGIVEAIELESQPFALGIQWHQEHFAGADHPGNAIFGAFVGACLPQRRQR
jgi:putative glutamine amidotransferase